MDASVLDHLAPLAELNLDGVLHLCHRLPPGSMCRVASSNDDREWPEQKGSNVVLIARIAWTERRTPAALHHRKDASGYFAFPGRFRSSRRGRRACRDHGIAGTSEIYYVGGDNHVYLLWYNGTWHVGDLSKATGAPNANP